MLFSIPEKALFGKNRHFNNTGNPLRVAYITGADLMITKSTFEKVGSFSPDFFLYFEETDLCLRILKLKSKVMNIPDAKIIHLEGLSFDFELPQVHNYMKGKQVYYKKNFGVFTRFLLNFTIWLTIYSAIILFSITGNVNKLKRWKVYAGAFKELISGI